MSIVLITGCSTGIGLHTALAFACKGDTVVATMRNPANASALHAAADKAGVAVDVVALDVTNAASAQAAVADVLKRHGRIDVLVNNAGVGLTGPVEDFPEDQARTCMETNFWGPVRMTRLVLPGMRAQGFGVIVNVSSITGRLPAFPTYAFYAASKHAVGALSESLAAEVAPFGIRVLCIEPGYHTTALTDTVDTLLGQLDAASPYIDVSRFMGNFSKQALLNGADPADVGVAIVAAVGNPSSPLHVHVGADADAFLKLWKETGTFESFGPAASAASFGEAAKANPKLTSNGHATHPSPAMIMKIGMGFWASKVLLTATRFELFTHLAEKGWLSAAQIMQVLRLKCTERNALDFLDTLTHFGFLERKGVLAGAVYGNGRDTAFFLDKNKPSYLGGILEMADDRLYGFWGDLKTAMGTGQQQNEAKCGIDFFGTLYSDPEKLKGFVNAMAGIQMGAFMAFAQQFDFSRSKSLVDIGGSGGHLSLMVAKHQPHMRCTSFDLPAVQPIAQGNIAHFQLTERVTTAAGDFFADTFPKADVITMGNILHDWDEEKKISLMRKAHDALPAGGAFVAIESVIDNDRRRNVFGLMMSLNMLIETSDGFDYTFADFEAWAKAAGFSRTALMPLAGPTSAAIAYK